MADNSKKCVTLTLTMGEAKHVLEVLYWRANEVVAPDHGMTARMYYELKAAIAAAKR